MVATSVARELGVPTVIIPPGPANFSALGMLMVDVVHDFAQTSITELDHVDVESVNQLYAALFQQGKVALHQDGFAPHDQAFVRSAELRYQGQEHTVNLALPEHDLTPADTASIAQAFNQAHATQYGHRTADPVEIVTFRLRAMGLLPRPSLPKVEAGTGNIEQAQKGNRAIHQPPLGQTRDYVVYNRLMLRRADRIMGPAIIEEPTSTTILHAGDSMTVGEYGELVITIGALSS